MIYAAIFSLFLGAVLDHSSARIYHPRGLNETAYEPLWKGFNPEICFAHGTEGLKGLIGDLSACGKVVNQIIEFQFSVLVICYPC